MAAVEAVEISQWTRAIPRHMSITAEGLAHGEVLGEQRKSDVGNRHGA